MPPIPVAPADKAYYETLLEKNRLRLAELEAEWAEIGPLRSIVFMAEGFRDHLEAEFFAKSLRRNGFKVLWGIGNTDYDAIYGVCEMEPKAEEVTQRDQWWESQIDEFKGELTDGPVYKGWEYPRNIPLISKQGTEGCFS